MAIGLGLGQGGCDKWAVPSAPPSETSPGPRTTGAAGERGGVDRQIRVLLLEGVRQFEFAVHGPFTLVDKSDQAVASGRGDRLTRTIGRVDQRDGAGLRLGPFRTNSPQVDLVPTEAGTLEITVFDRQNKAHHRRFRGRLRVVLTGEGTLDVLNVVDVEEYLRGVMCGELPASFRIETFKAQAIAARTYAFYQKATIGKWKHWDVKSDESSQMYIGLEGEKRSARALAAVEQTTGVVCTWPSPKGLKIFCTYYSSACGGCTQSVVNVKGPQARVPPLDGGVICNYCSISKNFRWPAVRLSKQTVTERLFRRESFAHLRALKGIEDVRVISTTRDGRATKLELLGVNGQKATIRAEDFRLLIGGHVLKSTYFDLERTRTHFIFRNGRGFGHGVGMCQYGAEAQARQGKKADEILSFYYPGCRLEAAYH